MNAKGDTSVLIAEGTAEEDQTISDSILTPLKIRRVRTAEEVIGSLANELPQLMISDLRLPDASGFSVCRRIREDTRTRSLPIILVSGWCSEMDRILAFECGADDFVPRPFSAREISNRVDAVLRRRPTLHDADSSRRMDLTGARPEPRLFAGSGCVRVHGRRIDLTPKENAILSVLVTRVGLVCSRRELVALAWPKEAAPSLRTIDSHIKTLRRKLGDAGQSLVTVRGIGYRFSAHPPALEIDLDDP